MFGVYDASTIRLIIICITYCASTGGQAQTLGQVELTYDDGPGVVGELIEYNDGKYRLQTSVGEITVPDDGVLCKGAACPAKEPNQAQVIHVSSLDGATVMSGELLEVKDGKYVLSTVVGVIEIDIDLVNCQGDGCIDLE